MEVRGKRQKTEEELKQEMYQEQWIDFMAQMIMKYADQMQPVFEAKEAELRARGTSSREVWEEIERKYYKAMGDRER